MIRSLVVGVFALAACSRAPAAATVDCAALEGRNAVQTEMRRLECAMQRSVSAIARDELATIPELIHVVHGARQATEKALERGEYQPTGADLATFVSMDEAFHRSLVQLVEAAKSGDHTATSSALGGALGQCQGCHAVFRPSAANVR